MLFTRSYGLRQRWMDRPGSSQRCGARLSAIDNWLSIEDANHLDWLVFEDAVDGPDIVAKLPREWDLTHARNELVLDVDHLPGPATWPALDPRRGELDPLHIRK